MQATRFHVGSVREKYMELQSCVSSTTPVKFLGGDLRRVSATIYIGAEHRKDAVCYIYMCQLVYVKAQRLKERAIRIPIFSHALDAVGSSLPLFI
jgi:hypothetical protein